MATTTKLTKADVASFADLSDEALQAEVDAIGTKPGHRFLSGYYKGYLKKQHARRRIKLLAELVRRGASSGAVG